MKTFSVSFLGRSFDESRWFREVAQQYGTDHHEFDLNPEEGLVDAIEQMAWHSDEPSADAGALPVWFLSKMCRRHVTVALSGEGADVLFGGYYTYLADRYAEWLRRSPAFLRRAGLSALSLWPVSDEKISLEYGSYAPGAPDVFIDDEEYRELWIQPQRWYLLAEGPQVPRFESLVGRDHLHVVKESGGKFLFTNQ